MLSNVCLPHTHSDPSEVKRTPPSPSQARPPSSWLGLCFHVASSLYCFLLADFLTKDNSISSRYHNKSQSNPADKIVTFHENRDCQVNNAISPSTNHIPHIVNMKPSLLTTIHYEAKMSAKEQRCFFHVVDERQLLVSCLATRVFKLGLPHHGKIRTRCESPGEC